MPLNNFSVHKSLEKCRKRIMQIEFIEGFLSSDFFRAKKHLPKRVELTIYMQFLKTFDLLNQNLKKVGKIS